MGTAEGIQPGTLPSPAWADGGSCLRYFARELGYGEEEDFWGLVGLLHDLDFEKYPEQHCRKEAEILKEKGWDDRLIHAVASHGWPRCSDVEPKEEMEKVLYAVDELSGLIGAAALCGPAKASRIWK